MSGSLAFFSAGYPQRGRRQRVGHGDGPGAGPSPGCPPRPAPPPRSSSWRSRARSAGSLGSQYYVEHPLFPLASTVMMFNCDMVGRLNGTNELTMIGTGTSPGLEDLVNVLGKSSGLKIKTIAGLTDGFGGSDHQSFYPQGIPVLFAFTGVHRDYHRPSDDSQPDQLRRDGPDRRLPGAARAGPGPAARASGVHPPGRAARTPSGGPRPDGLRRSTSAPSPTTPRPPRTA